MFDLLNDRGIDFDVVEYLTTPPDRVTLETILAQLNMSAKQLLRAGESIHTELGLDSNNITDEDALEAMLVHPILIERPIVVIGDKAAIGRPIERVIELLEQSSIP